MGKVGRGTECQGAEVDFGLLGSVTAVHDGGELTIGSAQQRCVLALLLLEAGRVVPAERLFDVLWSDDDVPKTARNVLQGCVSGLRRTCAVDPAVRLVHKSPGYLLEVAPERIDLSRFRALVAGADGRPAVLREALSLWRGEPLADVPGLDAVKHALAEERQSALEDCLDLELAQGGHNELIPELRALVGEHPLRERLRGQLMLALYRAGRTGDALRAFQDARRVLRDELGADPGRQLRQLHDQVLNASPELDQAAQPAMAVVPRQLPSAPSVFTGRGRELATLTVAPDAETVVISALGGLGGIGKTWLALHWAHDNLDWFPDGQLFVDLRGFDPTGRPMPPEAAVRGFLDALGVAADTIPVDLHAQAALYRSLVADKKMLIVLDNARDTTQVTPLLPGSPTCTVLITSRDRMRALATTHHARTLDLHALADADARDLLARRLGAPRIEREPEAVAELLAYCAGLPLALGIVAGRAAAHPHFPLAALADELRDARLDALDAGNPETNLAVVLSWSRNALTPEQAEVFALLGRVPGPDISLLAAANLTDLPLAEARSVLRALERASLVDEHQPGRYRMHDLVRRYAASLAIDDQPAVRRLVDFYLHTAHAAELLLTPQRTRIPFDEPTTTCRPQPLADEQAALEWFTAEHANLPAAHHLTIALDWYAAIWQLAWAMDTFHRRRGHFRDALHMWQAAATATEHGDDPSMRVFARRRLGSAYSQVGLHVEALEQLAEAVVEAERSGDLTEQVYTRYGLMAAFHNQKDYRRALEQSTEALRILQLLDLPLWEILTLNAMGWSEAQLGLHEQARTHCEHALALARQHGEVGLEHNILDSLGYIAYETGRYTEALAHYQLAARRFQDNGDGVEGANTLDRLGHAQAALGLTDQARGSWQQALELFQTQGRVAEAEAVRQQLDALKVGR
jgi:DNA-binding SARP family transcriptional activator/tetratricopeptide (TPR) repeat protein